MCIILRFVASLLKGGTQAEFRLTMNIDLQEDNLRKIVRPVDYASFGKKPCLELSLL